MSEPKEEKESGVDATKSKQGWSGSSGVDKDASFMMDLDLDFDNSWPFDQIFSAASIPTSPFLLSSALEQPFSPLWALSDEHVDEKTNGNMAGGRSSGAGLYPRLISYAVNPDSANEQKRAGEDKNEASEQKPPQPVLGLKPIDYPDGAFIMKERMSQALRYFKESSEQHVLAQVWAPVKNGGRFVLTTSGQPFVLDPISNGLHQYRMVSIMYKFSVDGDTDEVLGLPGRVFRQKLPEWTPNVQYYSSKEFPRLNHALNYNVRGTLALPVFENSGQLCIGVLELIMTNQKINYAPEVDIVCKALEAVNLKSSEILDQSNTQVCNEGRQNALVEILEILTVVCEAHNLPLAQTWVPCRHRSVLAYGGGLKKSCSSFDGSCMGQVCMSTTDVAFYVVDAHMWGFREACAEHHLQKGHGVTGRAFALHNACFCADITQFCKTDYPLVHYARMFGLSSCFAICLRSSHTGDDDYVLEFFLPPSITDIQDQKNLLDSLLKTMKPHFRSLRNASGKDLDLEWKSMEIITASRDETLELIPESIPTPGSAILSLPSSLRNGSMVNQDTKEKQLTGGYNSSNGGRDIDCKTGVQNVEPSETKNTGKKRGKAEKTISLEVLQQYFAGSLKDAAKSLGVCPTTMKRICRQHGISRWPSRKINKVNRSLSKLKRVIESVQGSEGTFTLTSLASSSHPVNVNPLSWPASMNGLSQQDSPGSKPHELLHDKNEFLGDMAPGFDEHAEDSHGSKTGSGTREESAGSPTSHPSVVGSPAPVNQTSPTSNLVVSSAEEQYYNVRGSIEFPCQPTGEINLINLAAVFSTPDTFVSSQPHQPFNRMPIEDVGSSLDLENLCRNGEAMFVERQQEYSWTNTQCSKALLKDSPPDQKPSFPARPEMKTITIKASYKEDVIRFRLSLDSGIDILKEEIAKRLKLEFGTFEIKYLDDDHEWVLIACDADLQECVDILRSSGCNIIRLLVHDMMSNLGSSCESSGE